MSSRALRLRPRRAHSLIATSVLGSLLLTWALLVGFDAFTQFARQLGDVGKDGYTLAQAALYIALTVPRRAYEMFGNAALIGGLLGLGGLAASGEMTALRAAGMSRWRIATTAMITVALLTVAVVVLGETLGPAGEQRAQALQVSVHARNLGMTTRSGLWARDGHRIINAKAALATEQHGSARVELADVRVFDFDNKGALQGFSWARSASQQQGQWQLSDVRITRFDQSGAHSRRETEQRWNSGLDPQLLKLSVIHPEYLSLRDLQRNIDYFRRNDQNPTSYRNAYWERVFYPINVLALVLCVLPFAFATMRSGGLGKRLFIGILLAVCWYFLQGAVVNVGTVYGVPAWLANVLPTAFLLLAVGVYFRRYG